MADNKPNYFEFYDMPISLQAEEVKIRRTFLEKSREYHPDFHTQASTEAQEAALEWSSFNNEAYKTLRDPDKRLKYVLELKGLLSNDSNNETLPQEFLMEMMEVNEKIMDLEIEPKSALYEEALLAIKAFENSLEASVGSILQEWTAETGSASDLLIAKDYFMKKKYLLRVKENLSRFASAFE